MMTPQRHPGSPFRPGPGGKLTSRPMPVATLWLIAIASLAHLARSMMSPGAQENVIVGLAMWPDVVLSGTVMPDAWVPAWLTPITALFLHANFMHLFNNMLWLLIFGGLTERVLGWPRLVALYLIAGGLGNLAEAYWTTDPRTLVVGASGAASGLFGAHLMLCLITARAGGPGREVLLRQAGVLAAVWALMQVLTVGIGPLNVAWIAHVSGLLAGFLLVAVLMPRPGVGAGRPSMPMVAGDGAPPAIDPDSADTVSPADSADNIGPPTDSLPGGRRWRRNRIPPSY